MFHGEEVERREEKAEEKREDKTAMEDWFLCIKFLLRPLPAFFVSVTSCLLKSGHHFEAINRAKEHRASQE